MIGGYLYQAADRNIDACLEQKLQSFAKVDIWDSGYFFYSNPFQSDAIPYAASPDIIALSEDLLVGTDGGAKYRHVDLERDFLPSFRRNGTDAFGDIQSDFRMAVFSKRDGCISLFLASNRAGAGRIYYHRLAGGIVFSSDLRFLLGVMPLDVNPVGIYSLLKYGLIPEPMTISRNISAVPASHYIKYKPSHNEDSIHPYSSFQFDCEADSPEVSLDGVKETLRRSASFLGNYPSAMLLSGGIDSSLYGSYMAQVSRESLQGFYCAFGDDDPEFPYASAIARHMGVSLKVATMEKADALQALDDVSRLTDHPFSDFSSLPIVFLLKFIREQMGGQATVVECNGGDDCFGFPDLQSETKYRIKHFVPEVIKKSLAACFRGSSYWKWESHEGVLARIAALADVHERSHLNYFLVQAPLNYFALDVSEGWDEILQELIEQTSYRCCQNYFCLGYKAKITVRQLLYVNSARWAAKALSVGESLGLRVIYPFIWHDVLKQQGKLPWRVKVKNGVVKWPLKKLLEEFMPTDFIYRKKSGFVPPLARWLTDRTFNQKVRDMLVCRKGFVSQILPMQMTDELLTDALNGKTLRFPILNMLWGAVFAESWIQRWGQAAQSRN
jgi:asparagine synthase (glutamine-hydrolysing)